MTSLIRSAIRAMKGYTPGEQPREDGIIKLNTNENPYPPSPRVFEAIQTALTGDRLRKYPDPVGTLFRQTAARLHDHDPEGILIGNGSDDILTIVTRAFVPEGGLIASPTPSYLLYRTLAELQGARFQNVPFTADWQLPLPWPASDAQLTFVANPNSPTGTLVSLANLEAFARACPNPLVIDEAYVDFADHDARPLLRHPQVILTRTLSKSYALAGIRFGYALGSPAVIRELSKVKDSYNCDVLSLAAATAALQDQDYLRATLATIRATRTRLDGELQRLGFATLPSSANFLWCTHPSRAARTLYEELKRRNILVRYMVYEGFGEGLRISVGSDAEIDRLLHEVRSLV